MNYAICSFNKKGAIQESNLRPLVPEMRIIPLDQSLFCFIKKKFKSNSHTFGYHCNKYP